MKGFAYVCERHDRGFPAAQFFDALAQASLSLSHPKEDAIYRWTDDGDRLVTSRDALERDLASGLPAVFELWFPTALGFACSFRTVAPSVYQFALDLEDVDKHDGDVITAFAISRFRSSAGTSEAELLIVDSTGVTADFDWDDFVRGTAHPPAWPEAVGLRATRYHELALEFADYRSERVGECVLLSRRAFHPYSR